MPAFRVDAMGATHCFAGGGASSRIIVLGQFIQLGPDRFKWLSHPQQRRHHGSLHHGIRVQPALSSVEPENLLRPILLG